jgi:hypothetical protein
VLALIAIALGLGCWRASSAAPAAVRFVARTISTAIVILAVAQASSDLVRVVSRLLGLRLADVHDRPYRSLTLADFWSCRWNRTAARWFRQHLFFPVRRAGLAAALFVLFAVNGAGHVYLVAATTPPRAMAMCFVFFLLQPVLLLAERKLRVRQWRPAAARAWTIATLTALLPLLLIPLGFPL